MLKRLLTVGLQSEVFRFRPRGNIGFVQVIRQVSKFYLSLKGERSSKNGKTYWPNFYIAIQLARSGCSKII